MPGISSARKKSDLERGITFFETEERSCLLSHDLHRSSLLHLGENLRDDIVQGSHIATAAGVALDAAGAVHSHASSGHAHPVGQGSSDIPVATTVIFAPVTFVDATSLVIGGSKDRGAFANDFLHDGIGAHPSRFGRTSGAYRGVDGDVLTLTDQELCTLVTEINSDLGVLRSSRCINRSVLVDLHCRAVVAFLFEGFVGSEALAVTRRPGAAHKGNRGSGRQNFFMKRCVIR